MKTFLIALLTMVFMFGTTISFAEKPRRAITPAITPAIIPIPIDRPIIIPRIIPAPIDRPIITPSIMPVNRERQSEFARKLPLLILFAYERGYEITLGDAWADSGHKAGSFHYKRLAIDLNLFKDGKFLTETKDHEPLGLFWESLDPLCSWGGRWGDGNHYSFGE